MPVLNTIHHPENRETTVLLRPKDLHRPSVAGLVVFVAIYFNCLEDETLALDETPGKAGGKSKGKMQTGYL